MGNERQLMAVLLAAAISLPAAAESTSDALTRIEAETLLLKARERQLEVQASILNRQNEIALKQGIAGGVPQPPAGPEPLVRSIEGLGAKMYATLDFGGGALVEVEPGQLLSNGMRVISIGAAGVAVRNKAGKHIQLGMGGEVVRPPAAAPMATGPALPPLPPFPPQAQKGPAR